MREIKSKILKTGRRQTVTIKRPAVPHLHLVDLRKEEQMINKALFNESKSSMAVQENKGAAGGSTKGTGTYSTMVKTIFKDEDGIGDKKTKPGHK